MVVRDEQGKILDPDITSNIQLYWQHELATERIRIEHVCSEVLQDLITDVFI